MSYDYVALPMIITLLMIGNVLHCFWRSGAWLHGMYFPCHYYSFIILMIGKGWQIRVSQQSSRTAVQDRSETFQIFQGVSEFITLFFSDIIKSLFFNVTEW